MKDFFKFNDFNSGRIIIILFFFSLLAVIGLTYHYIILLEELDYCEYKVYRLDDEIRKLEDEVDDLEASKSHLENELKKCNKEAIYYRNVAQEYYYRSIFGN